MAEETPSSTESWSGRSDTDLAAQMLHSINELSAEDICSFSRRLIGEPVYFSETLSGGQRRELAKADQQRAIASLFDIRLGEVVTSPGAPEVISWRSRRGFIEATVVRCNEAVLFAHEVIIDHEGGPLGTVNALWTGNNDAVEDFLANYVVEAKAGPVEVADNAPGMEEEAERVVQRLAEAPPRLRNVGLAFLALMTLENAMRAVPAGGNFMRAMPPARRELPEESRPRSHALRHAAGPMPPAISYRKQPIRQPKPQSGAKWGKRSQF